ncbi:MAG: M50 family metallopeptidase [Lewinellaceae bacterium]|nr:M50 family metallopeptidase [Saprospiraceae bacterium]MCB0544914.1 M50 family metallopeptidase [Saprospiraceae bacterium]MCB9307179.1 M50 family metallopeptidase [Lewinellaceae bacterium]MCB9353836.1 M50 family metallopeptidase [Lewinellaceae bacterium]
MSNKLHLRLLMMVVVYAVLRFAGGSFGNLVLYPVTLLVTFLHEFGHALGALLTGGAVEGMQINTDGSGYTVTRGGSQGIVLMGGYIGSAALGNLLFYIGARHRQITQVTLVTLACIMALAGIVWFESVTSSALLIGFGAAIYFIARQTNWDQDVLMFLGLAAVLYIIQDFNVGPGSDLAMYEKAVGIFSSEIWMYVWLALVAALSFWNLRAVFSR